MKQKITKGNHTLSASIGIGLGASVLSAILFASIVALMISSEKISEESMQLFTYITLCVSSLIGALIAGKRTAGKYALSTGSTAISFAFALIATGILFFNGGFHNLLLNTLSILIGGVIACTICITSKPNGRRRKMRNR